MFYPATGRTPSNIAIPCGVPVRVPVTPPLDMNLTPWYFRKLNTNATIATPTHRTSYNDSYDTISWCTISWLFCLGGPKACQFDEGLFDTSRQPNVSLSPKYQSWIPKLPLDRRNSPKPSKTIHFVFLYFFVFFPLRPKMQFVFLYVFCIFPVLHRLHFVPFVFFSFFRHAVKEQNRESINAASCSNSSGSPFGRTGLERRCGAAVLCFKQPGSTAVPQCRYFKQPHGAVLLVRSLLRRVPIESWRCQHGSKSHTAQNQHLNLFGPSELCRLAGRAA